MIDDPFSQQIRRSAIQNATGGRDYNAPFSVTVVLGVTAGWGLGLVALPWLLGTVGVCAAFYGCKGFIARSERDEKKRAASERADRK